MEVEEQEEFNEIVGTQTPTDLLILISIIREAVANTLLERLNDEGVSDGP